MYNLKSYVPPAPLLTLFPASELEPLLGATPPIRPTTVHSALPKLWPNQIDGTLPLVIPCYSAVYILI